MDALRPVGRTLLRDRAYEALREAIVRGDLAPGAPLKDADLADRLGLSRAPVREALARLGQEGLVESKPQSYTRVTRPVSRVVRDAASVVRVMHELAARTGVPLLGPEGIRAMREANERFAAAAAAPAQAAPAAATNYADNLDGWIQESLAIMAQRGIPGSYEGIHRNIMRESSGNPQAINLWDSNAMAGTPSKGLLQVIEPTFLAYHVPGTSMDLFDPVANITAACNYAADRYGSIDNVNGAY